MQIVPINPVPSQTLTVTLADQLCSILIRQTSTGLYLSLSLPSGPIISSTLCLNTVRLVRDAYLGFVGDLAFFDTQSFDDPQFTGLGSRWFLAYLETADLGGLS